MSISNRCGRRNAVMAIFNTPHNTNSMAGSSSSRWSLAGMTALAIGGTRGIGLLLLWKSWRKWGNEEELNQRLQEWSSDVTGSVSREQRSQLMDKVSSVFGAKLDILVGNGNQKSNESTYKKSGAKDNIRVNSVAPWYIKTSFVKSLLEKKELLDRVVSRTPGN